MIQFQFRYETVKVTEKKYSLVILKKALKGLYGEGEAMEEEDEWEEGVNKNLEVRVEEVVREKQEERKIPINYKSLDEVSLSSPALELQKCE
mmetsp:Transcript_24591/g.18641  ORF Transcript_24591/g.18641 Transcript_24591/m.18641 type:complete len:92 (+) Transcript_24591:932-1207(+)